MSEFYQGFVIVSDSLKMCKLNFFFRGVTKFIKFANINIFGGLVHTVFTSKHFKIPQ
jgi:hypothetical protein